ncbi:MAG: hypothetical protein ACRDIE_23110, partial [Chloroflexota bacterium]
MPTKILIATVGGSSAPLVRSIKDNHPDFVYFLCSDSKDGSTRVVDGRWQSGPEHEPAAPSSIVGGTDIREDQYQKILIPLAEMDDLRACYEAAGRAFQEALAKSEPVITADYTGGSKTMSAALVRAASGPYARDTARFSVISGERTKLTVVADGTEIAVRQGVDFATLGEQTRQALALANDHHYTAADTLLSRLLLDTEGATAPERARTQMLSTLCRGFDAWDRFDHAEALRLLRAQATKLDPRLLADLRELVKSAEADYTPEQWGASSVMPVY